MSFKKKEPILTEPCFPNITLLRKKMKSGDLTETAQRGTTPAWCKGEGTFERKGHGGGILEAESAVGDERHLPRNRGKLKPVP